MQYVDADHELQSLREVQIGDRWIYGHPYCRLFDTTLDLQLKKGLDLAEAVNAGDILIVNITCFDYSENGVDPVDQSQGSEQTALYVNQAFNDEEDVPLPGICLIEGEAWLVSAPIIDKTAESNYTYLDAREMTPEMRQVNYPVWKIRRLFDKDTEKDLRRRQRVTEKLQEFYKGYSAV